MMQLEAIAILVGYLALGVLMLIAVAVVLTVLAWGVIWAISDLERHHERRMRARARHQQPSHTV